MLFIVCACGCNAQIPSHDNRNRPRKYVLGHTQRGRKRPDQAPIMLRIRKTFKGPLNPRWKGGLTEKNQLIRHSKEYNDWRKAVYRRDNWTCQKCFMKIKETIAHHIKNFRIYVPLRFDVDNGVTLCRSCHKKVHQQIGMKTRFKSLVSQFTWKIKNA